LKIIVLTAGLGTRLRPHTLTRPKALLKVAGRPVLAYILDKLMELETRARDLEFIFVNGWLGEQIVAYVEQEYVQSGKIRAHFVEQVQPLGQAHAIGLAHDLVLAQGDDPEVLVVFGDTIFDTDFLALNKLPTEVAGALFVNEVEDPRRFGVAVIDPTNGYVKQVVEKPAEPISKLAICSPYYFKSARQLLGAIEKVIQSGRQTKGEYFLADAIAQMLEAGALLQPLPMPIWLDAGTFQAMLETNRALLEIHQVTIKPLRAVNASVILLEPVWIDTDVIIERSVIGPHVAISKGAVIQDSVVADSIIEEGSQLNGVSVRHTLVGRFTKINGPAAFTGLNLGDYSEI